MQLYESMKLFEFEFEFVNLFFSISSPKLDRSTCDLTWGQVRDTPSLFHVPGTPYMNSYIH